MSRTLYQCSHAIVHGALITCARMHPIGRHGAGVSLRSLIRGDELCLPVCRDCPDFDCNGPAIKKQDRGWTPNEYERNLLKGLTT